MRHKIEVSGFFWCVAKRSRVAEARRERRRLQRRRSLPVERRNARRPRRNVLREQVQPTETARGCSNYLRAANIYSVRNGTLSRLD